ncbi:MAG TPA: hypothetical protein DCS97_02140 [Planctomycetes bacterium]|nr:hypothetical protein [Planctomycetota bacterium]
MTDLARLDALIARHLDGRADADELVELDAALCASPDAARRFAAQARIDGDLRTASRATGAQVVGTITQRIAAAERQASRHSARRVRTRPQPRRWLLPLAAGLVAMVGVLAWLAGGMDPAPPFVSAGRPVQPGMALAGVVAINGGGSIVLAAGSVAEAAGIASSPELRLDRGRVDCSVAPRTEGHFSVVTPHGRMEVIGTSFAVAVGEETQLTVREGIVEASAGGERHAVGPGGMANFAGGAVRALQPILRPLSTASISNWNNNSPGITVTAAGTGPTGASALCFDFRAGRGDRWASCRWLPGLDWRDADGLSLVLFGGGTGKRILVEVMDDGADREVGGRDRYERFAVGFDDDVVGWHERRFPFNAFVRRDDLWPGIPNDGFGRERVHGISLIPSQTPLRYTVERIGIYRSR